MPFPRFGSIFSFLWWLKDYNGGASLTRKPDLLYPWCQRSSRSPEAWEWVVLVSPLHDSPLPLNSVAPNKKKTSGSQGRPIQITVLHNSTYSYMVFKKKKRWSKSIICHCTLFYLPYLNLHLAATGYTCRST